MRAIYLALLAGGAFGARVATHKDLQRDVQKDVSYPGPNPDAVDTLASIPLPVALTPEQRMRDRTSLTFVRHMLAMKDAEYTELFCSYSEDDCATVDEYPGYDTHTEMRLDVVVEELAKTPEREVRGEIVRLGDLGYLIFNDLLWANDWKTFPIGADLADHRKGRPVADALMGSNSEAWSREMIRESAEEFFRGRESFNQRDMIRWNNKLLHKILMDLDLTDEEETIFEDYKGSSTTMSTLPRWLVSGLRWVFGLHQGRETRDMLLEKYQEAFDRDTRGLIPALEGRDKRFMADLLLTALTSAGGLSVPSVMGNAFGILHGAESYGNVVFPEWQTFELTNRNVEQFVLETVRRHPVVVGFPWWDPENQSFRTVLNLAMSMRDPRAWEAPLEFRLRPLSEYHEQRGTGTKIGVAYAQQAIGNNGLTPDSRGCPGQELSVVIISELLRAYVPTQHQWTATPPSGGIQITEGPSKCNDYTITRHGHIHQGIAEHHMTTPAPQNQDEADAEAMAGIAR
jgi:hypothetical protein